MVVTAQPAKTPLPEEAGPARGSGANSQPSAVPLKPSRAELVVPVTYHCITNYPKLSESKHGIFLYLMISQVRGSGQAREGKSSAPHGGNRLTQGTD